MTQSSQTWGFFFTQSKWRIIRVEGSYFKDTDTHTYLFLSYPLSCWGPLKPKMLLLNGLGQDPSKSQFTSGTCACCLTSWGDWINRDPFGLHWLLVLPIGQLESRQGGQQEVVGPAQRPVPWMFSHSWLNWSELGVHLFVNLAVLYHCPWLVNHVVLSVTKSKLWHLPTPGFLAACL